MTSTAAVAGRWLLVLALAVALLVVVVRMTGSDNEDRCGGEAPAKAGGGHWTCTFDDEFDGTSLDRSKWAVTTAATTGYRSGPECYLDDPANVRVGDGTLVLRGERLPTPVRCELPHASFATPYTSGMVSTRDHFAQRYGRFEIRAAFPDTPVTGVHSAIWLWPQALTYGGNGVSGEIDLVEYYSGVAPDVGYATLKYHPLLAHQPPTTGCRLEDPSAFHTYLLEWTDDLVRISYDGHTCLATQWRAAAPLQPPAPFDRPFNVVLTQALGSGSIAVSPQMRFPVTMKVDYVRVWR